MSRPAAPRWYESRKAWYVELGGKQHLLAKGKANKAEAFKRFNQLMAEGTAQPTRRDLTVQALAELFIDWNDGKVEPVTQAGYKRRLQSFIDAYGNSPAADVRPYHVTQWLAKHPAWNDSTRFGYVTAVKRLYNWATRQGYLDANPVKNADKPAMGRRAQVLTAEQAERIIAHVRNPRFRDLLVAIWDSGCRPNEVFTLTADRVDLAGGTWRVVNKTRRKTGEPTRLIYLTDRLRELSARLVAERPAGPLFVNARGNPWTNGAMSCAWDDLRKQLGYGHEVTAYAFRHRYVTDALVNGVPIATVAALVGHRGTAMISKHYSHLDEQHQHLRAAANLIRGGASPCDGSASRGCPSPAEPPPPPDPAPEPPPPPGTSRDGLG